MLKPIKSLFILKFQTELEMTICEERLTNDFYDKKVRCGEISSGMFTWGIGFDKNRRNEKRAVLVWYRTVLNYVLSLEQNQGGTIIECRHFPFNFLGLLLPGIAALVSLIFCIASAIFNNGSSFVGSFAFFIAFFLVCVFLESCARGALKRYLFQFLDCKTLED